MLVNAGIKSKKELAQRLIDGEVFYFQQSCGTKYNKIFFDEEEVYPFRVEDFELDLEWKVLGRFFIEQNWWDNIPEKGVLCWVDDTDPTRKTNALYIVKRDHWEEYGYIAYGDVPYKYATPVLPEECLQHD